MKKIFILIICMSFYLESGEVNSWECNKFEGAIILGEDEDFLGTLGPSWKTDSIFNDSSNYGNTYSSTSVFNESATNPPKIFSEDGFLGYLSIGPSWNSERFSPYDFKYTCDWD